MKRVALTIMLLLALAAPAQAGEWFSWDETNTKLHIPLTALMLVDLGQTLDIAENCKYEIDGFYGNLAHYHYSRSESNYALGSCPSKKQVKQYFAWAYAIVTGAAFIAPPKPSYAVQGGTIGIEVYAVGKNLMVGVGFKFP